MKNFTFVFSVLFLCSIIFSCEKEEETAIDPNAEQTIANKQASVDANVATSNLTKSLNLVLNYGIESAKANKKVMFQTNASACPTKDAESTNSGSYYPRKVTLDYGDGCTSSGKEYSGNIAIVFSGSFTEAGTSITVTFNSFQYDTIRINGELTLTLDEIKIISGSYATYIVKITDIEIGLPSDKYTINANKKINIYVKNLLNDPSISDFEILELTSNIKKEKGSKEIDILVEEKLFFESDCKEFVSGKLEVKENSSKYPATIDFGDGTCDGKATVSTTLLITSGGKTTTKPYSFDIDLP